MMKSKIGVQSGVGNLGEICKVFEKWRSNRGGKGAWYPPELRQMAVAAVESGHKIESVARAAQVSVPSVWNWRKAKAIESPRRLKVVQEKSQVSFMGTASIEFQSGIRIELPVAALSASLLKSLNQSGQEP